MYTRTYVYSYICKLVHMYTRTYVYSQLCILYTRTYGSWLYQVGNTSAGKIPEVKSNLGHGQHFILQVFTSVQLTPVFVNTYQHLFFLTSQMTKIIVNLPFCQQIILSTLLLKGMYTVYAKTGLVGDYGSRNLPDQLR